MIARGTVKGNTIVLDDGSCLPEGATVEVRLIPEPAISREEAFARFWEQRAANADLCLNVDELIEEDREEREARVDEWLTPATGRADTPRCPESPPRGSRTARPC
jgi:hypothetical protein